jgi:hypothetical protein
MQATYLKQEQEQDHGFTCANLLGLERSWPVIELQAPSKLSSVKIIPPLTKQLARDHQLWLPTSSSLPTMSWENRFNLSNKSDERHHKNEECKKLIVSGIIKHLRHMKFLPSTN